MIEGEKKENKRRKGASEEGRRGERKENKGG